MGNPAKDIEATPEAQVSLQTRRTWCGLCHSRCGLTLDVEDGRATAVRGDPEHPSSRGRTCRRGRMMLEHLYHPDRLDVPLRRVGERRSDYELWKGLGRRLGQRDRWPWETARDVCEHRLAPAGITFDALIERGSLFEEPPAGRFRKHGFGTPSRKVELASSTMESLGLDPLPDYRPDPGPSDAFPLRLITGSGFEPMYHSEQRQWPSARAAAPHPRVSIHPETAEELGIRDGDWVRVETASGSIRQRAQLDSRLPPDTVDAQHGWWFPERGLRGETPGGCLESNVNVLCADGPQQCAPATGGWMQTGLVCRIVRE